MRTVEDAGLFVPMTTVECFVQVAVVRPRAPLGMGIVTVTPTMVVRLI